MPIEIGSEIVTSFF